MCCKSLSEAELGDLFERAQQAGIAGTCSFDAAAQERIIGYADGDARRLLNVLEQLQTAAQVGQV